MKLLNAIPNKILCLLHGSPMSFISTYCFEPPETVALTCSAKGCSLKFDKIHR